jgi:UDP-2-acetamido-3-amino-2,3-dideoxy-glucuronate N-acetyltransferase
VDAVLHNPDIQGVVIASSAVTHSAIAKYALEAGKDVLVEKPLALVPEEGRGLVELARERGRILMVGHVLEYHPAVDRLHKFVTDGSLGRIQYLYSNRLNLGRIRSEENVLWSFAPHDIAIMLRLLEFMPEEVTCHGGEFLTRGVADTTLTHLRFPGGISGHIFVSWLNPFKEHRFVVMGDQRMAVFDDTRPWPEKLVLYPHRVDWLGGRVPVALQAQGEPVSLEEREPLLVECEEFIHSIRTRCSPRTDGESGLQVLRVLAAAQRSLEEGSRRVSLSGDSKAPPRYQVHPTATVDPGVDIGNNTKIWHYSHVMPGVKIGHDCVLGQNIFVGRGVRIGDGVKIQNNVSVYEGVELEDYVFCGPSMVFTNVVNPRSEIDRKEEFRSTLVKRGATLGANCTVICGTTIGRYAMVGAGAVVTKDVPDYALVVGVPAHLSGWVCSCGGRLNFADATAKCGVCDQAYEQLDDFTLKRATQPEEF